MEYYEAIIIGGGIAGITALMYLTKFKVKALMITDRFGGLLQIIENVQNYPGLFNISGKEFIKKLKEQLKLLDAKWEEDLVIDIKKENDYFIVETETKKYRCKAIIFATGTKRRSLGIPGENLKGVSYCASCDAIFFRNKKVAVIGGGNTAAHECKILLNYAREVYLIHRRREFRMFEEELEELKNKGVKILVPYVVKEIKGKEKVEKIVLENVETKEVIELDVDGVVIAIGEIPNVELAKKLGVNVNEKGEIVVDDYMRTNVPFVYACGDVTSKAVFKQLVVAAAQGAIAAKSCFEDLRKRQ